MLLASSHTERCLDGLLRTAVFYYSLVMPKRTVEEVGSSAAWPVEGGEYCCNPPLTVLIQILRHHPVETRRFFA